MRDRPAVALVVAAIAAALFVLARRHSPPPAATPREPSRVESGEAIARPPEAVAELGVLTEATEAIRARLRLCAASTTLMDVTARRSACLP